MGKAKDGLERFLNIAFDGIRFDSGSLARVIGFACNRAWAYVCFFSIALFYVPGSLQVPIMRQLYVGSAIALSVTLAVAGVFHGSIEKVFRTTPGHYVGPCVAALGSMLIPFSSGGDWAPLFLAVAALLTGIGSGLLLLSWGISFSKLPLNRCVVESCTAYVAGVLLYALLSVTPLSIQYVFVISLPLFSAWLCVNSNSIVEDEGYERPVLAKQGSSFARLLVGILLLGFVAGLVRDIQPATVRGASSSGYCIAMALITTAIIIAFLILVRRGKTLKVNVLFRPALIAMLCGVLFLPVFGTSSLVSAALVKSGYTCFELLVWIVLASMCHEFRFSPVQLFGLGRSAIAGAGILGSLVAFAFVPDILGNQTNTVILSALVAIVLTIMSNVFFVNDDITKIWKNPPDERITFKDRCEELFEAYELSPKQREVAYLLAYGRDANYISDKLSISKGTLNSHRLNIYRKLNIHSRQELLDMIAPEGLDEDWN